MKYHPPLADDVFNRILTALRALHAGAFPNADLPPRPLKIGIHMDMRAAFPELPRRQLKRFLHRYVHQTEYFASCSDPTSPRYDLTGEPIGNVGEKAAAHAARMVERRTARARAA